MPCCARRKKEKESPLDLCLLPFYLSPDKLMRVVKSMDEAMTRGLQTTEDVDVRMFPTFIQSVPNSKETGEFLSLDLGISVLTISLVDLKGKHIKFAINKSDVSHISKEKLHSPPPNISPERTRSSFRKSKDDRALQRDNRVTSGEPASEQMRALIQDTTSPWNSNFGSAASEDKTVRIQLSPENINEYLIAKKISMKKNWSEGRSWNQNPLRGSALDHTLNFESYTVDVTDTIKTGSGTQLFDFLVENLKIFLKNFTPDMDLFKPLNLGFGFPCPCRKTGIANGVLTNWTKGYSCEGVIGEDVSQLLQDALNRQGLQNIQVVALLNDTLGTLLAGAYGPGSTSVLMGITLGTGTNAVYQEAMDCIPEPAINKESIGVLNYAKKVLGRGESIKREYKQMIFDTEWGALGETGALEFLRTDVDRSMDASTINPKKDIFAKMICGMYLGDLVRRILFQLHTDGLLLPNSSTPFLEKLAIMPHLAWKDTTATAHLTFQTKLISLIECDRGVTFKATKLVLDQLGIENVSNEDCRIIKRVCEVVTTRAAHLAAAATVAIIVRIPREMVTVAIDGALFRYHPFFEKRFGDMIFLLLKIRQALDNSKKRFALKLVNDGAAKGAGLAAAMSRLHKD